MRGNCGTSGVRLIGVNIHDDSQPTVSHTATASGLIVNFTMEGGRGFGLMSYIVKNIGHNGAGKGLNEGMKVKSSYLRSWLKK